MRNLKVYILIVYCLLFLNHFSNSQEPKGTEYVKKSYYDGASIKVPEGATPEEMVKLASEVRPSARQLRWQQHNMLGFVCLNLNTWTGVEWGTGREDLSLFNPEKLDANQWIDAFKKAGIQSVILVCKHHDGFCLWPGKYRERTIAKTPYKHGQGDIVREFTDACRKEGIGICLYYSPWDMQEPYGKPEYNDLMVNELTELLTNYGLVDLVWFDGAGIDPKVSGVKMDFDWQRIYSTIRTLQPQALISGAGPDIRWVGNEGGRGRFTEWSVQGIQLPEADFSGNDSGVPLTDDSLGYRKQLTGAKQLAWYPARGGLPVRYGWFWHPGQSSRPLSYLIDSYFETVGQNSNLLVNLSPDTCGLVPEEDVQLMADFGNYLKAMYKHNYASGAVAHATTVRDGGYAANYIFDEDIRTCWVAPAGSSTGEIIIDLYGRQEFNVVELREAVTEFGQRIEKFIIEAWTGTEWREIGEATTVGFCRLLRVPDTKTNKIKITILESRKSPSIATLKLYYAPKPEAPPAIKQNAQGKVILEGNYQSIIYTTDGSSPLTSQMANIYNHPFDLPGGGIVKAAFEPNNTKTWKQESMAYIGMATSGWDIKGVTDKDALTDFSAETQTGFNSKQNPALEVILPEKTRINGFSYMPIQEKIKEFGHIETYTLYLKDKNGNWQKVQSGTFENIYNNPVEQHVRLKAPVSSDRFKLVVGNKTKITKGIALAGIKFW